MCKNKVTNRRGGGRRRGGGCRGRGGKDFGWAEAQKKVQDFYENLENEQIEKNMEKIDKNR